MKELKDAYKAIYEKANDGNLANNAPPYDKVTRRDVITGALGKDEMGGKRKAHDCAKKVNYKKEEYDCIPEQHTMLEDGTVTHYDITKDNLILHNIPVEELEILISEKHEHFDNYDKNAEVLGEDAKYDRNRKRAAQRAAARNAARDAGKTGVVPGVGYVSPRREKETYVDSAGTTRHKSGAKNEEVEQYVDFLIAEGYDCSELTWDDMSEEYASLDEGLRSAMKRFLGKKDAEKKPESRGEQLRKKYNVGPEKSDTSAKMLILKKTRAKKEADQKQYGDSKYSKSVAKKSAEVHDRYLKGGYSKYGAGDARGKGNKARKRAERLTKEELEATGKFTAEEIERILGIEEGLGMAVKAAGKMVAKQAAQGAVDRAGEAAYNKARNMGKKPKPACEEVEVTEHHQKDAEGKVIEHEETTPSSVEEGMKQARKNVGASTCWDGYKAKGTKKKGGKEVPNCVKEEETGGVLVQDAADYTPTEIETVDVVKPEPLKFQIEDHGVKFSEKNEEVVVDPTELVKKHAPNIAAARPLDEIAPLAALAVGAKAMAKKAVVGAAKSAAKGMATNAMSKVKDRMSGSGNNNNMA